MLPEQLHEATRSELLLRMLTRAARDHGPAAFVPGPDVEDNVVVDAIRSARLPIEILACSGRLDADALAEKNALITSVRGEAAPSGAAVPAYEYDAALGVLKFNPLAAWTAADVQHYLRERSAPASSDGPSSWRTPGPVPGLHDHCLTAG
jgi:hypothetical protein